MTKDYKIMNLKSGIYLNGEVAASVKNFTFVPGLCAASIDDSSLPRDREGYLREVIEPLVIAGKISDCEQRDALDKIVKYNDLKFRNDGMDLQDGTLTVRLGISHFLAFRADQKRGIKYIACLEQRGVDDFSDSRVYFQDNPGVAGLVLDYDGNPYLGSRMNADATGRLNSVAGHLEYKSNLSDVDLFQNLGCECYEEMGIFPEDVVSTRFVGVFAGSAGDHDFTFLVQTNLPGSYFAKNGAWESRRKTREHDELICLSSENMILQLLEEGRLPGYEKMFNVMYSTRGGLEEFLRIGRLRV